MFLVTDRSRYQNSNKLVRDKKEKAVRILSKCSTFTTDVSIKVDI